MSNEEEMVLLQQYDAENATKEEVVEQKQFKQ